MTRLRIFGVAFGSVLFTLSLASCSSGAKQAQRTNKPKASKAKQERVKDVAEARAIDPPASAPRLNPEEEPQVDAVDTTPTVTFHAAQGEVIVAVEVADTVPLRTRGMMYRESVEADHGMIFVFAEDAIHPFWMKNTYIPLDMIHLNADLKVVGVVESAEPLSLARRAIDVPSRYVVEVAGGYAEEHGIVEGVSASLANVPREPQP